MQEPSGWQRPGPVWQRSLVEGGGQLLAQVGPLTGSHVAVAQLAQKMPPLLSQDPPVQVPVSQQPGMEMPPVLQGALAVQAEPQPPQLLASVETSTQAPPQQT